jgi:hypothetical protein
MEFLKISSKKWIRVQTSGDIVLYSILRSTGAILRILIHTGSYRNMIEICTILFRVSLISCKLIFAMRPVCNLCGQEFGVRWIERNKRKFDTFAINEREVSNVQ